MKRIATKSIVEGALLLGILVVLSLLTIYTPLSLVTFLLLPTPIIFAVIRHNIKLGLMISFLSIILLIIVGVDPYTSLVNMIFASFIGLTLGYSFNKKISPSFTFLLTSIATLLSFICIFYLAVTFLEYDFIDEMIEIQISSLELVQSYLQQSGNNLGIDKGLIMSKADMIYIFPALLILGSMFYGYLVFVVTQKILKKFKVPCEEFPPFSHWKFGYWLLWLFVLAQLAPIIFPQLVRVGVNLLQVTAMVIVLQGIAIVTFYIKKIKSKPLRIVTMTLVILNFFGNPLFFQILLLVSIGDFFINIRRI
ncbi:Uncharacterized conserved protein YybS, DUF2232 family [Anaerobranca californiensis DSM 14826]|uniref:Uncharacterized conserved protein YybS, DUF2232 family n=1 Tax=Anaerobranca californiensis DSM 14826 TaxID=1120989 RepID=A0A1M6M446_9FIRM|nr:DUF2232 domain-containing protein [Anaerobranca californiensis]SHJ78150.1 Uncharacterized conserved protein YybS, DUF2232 family [Anaerobranca californiensis DSM 14826]